MGGAREELPQEELTWRFGAKKEVTKVSYLSEFELNNRYLEYEFGMFFQ